jgi:hypothetical protein
MDENLAKELCLSLIKADTEEEVIQLLRAPVTGTT